MDGSDPRCRRCRAGIVIDMGREAVDVGADDESTLPPPILSTSIARDEASPDPQFPSELQRLLCCAENSLNPPGSRKGVGKERVRLRGVRRWRARERESERAIRLTAVCV